MSFRKPGSLSRGAFGVTFDAGRKRKDVERELHEGQQENQFNRAGFRAQQYRLPVHAHKDQILYLIENHSVVIILGETGSGKTTQIPQFLLDAGWAPAGKQVAVTQPRRAAAATIAARVAEERGEDLGKTVGYAVRFDSVESQNETRIRFVTDGLLLREMMEDPLLTRYSVIMVDEAHERSLATDTLLGLLKKILRRRPELRIIVSSATLEAPQLVALFTPSGGGAAAQQAQHGAAPRRDPAVVSVQGRTFPVEVHYSVEASRDYVRAAVDTVVDIHKADLPGDVLVFLTGQQEVEDAVRQLDQEAEHLARSSGYGLKLLPLPLYAGLPGNAQQTALSATPRGWRKVVVATNIAETSLTLEGVVYVVDSCFVKQRAFNPLLGLEALCVAPASKASATQRAGRAGRVRAGKVFRLCTQEHYNDLLPEKSVPEMQRSDLTGLVLQLKAIGIDNILHFGWLSPPPAEALVRALETLAALGVVDTDAKLTKDVGLKVAALPLEPPMAVALLASFKSSRPCSEEMLTIAACLAAAPHGLFVTPAAAGGLRALDEAKSRFGVAEGDLVSMLNVWRAWKECGKSRKWCTRNCVNQHSMHKAFEVRQQLAAACTRMGCPPPESCDGDMDHLRQALVAGFFMNAACFERTDYNPLASESDPGTHVYRLVRPVGGTSSAASGTSGAVDSSRLRLRIHSQSMLFRCRPEWVVFTSVQQSDSGWYEMQHVTSISKDWLLQEASHYYRVTR